MTWLSNNLYKNKYKTIYNKTTLIISTLYYLFNDKNEASKKKNIQNQINFGNSHYGNCSYPVIDTASCHKENVVKVYPKYRTHSSNHHHVLVSVRCYMSLIKTKLENNKFKEMK